MPESNQEQPLFERQSPWRWIWFGLGAVVLYQLLLGLWHDQGYDLRSGILLCIATVQIGLPLWMLRMNGAPARATLRLHLLSPTQCLWLLVLAAGLVLPVEWLAQWNTRWVPVPDWSTQFQDQLRPDSARDWVMSILVLAVFAPAGEEILFRGLMQQAMRTVTGGQLAAIVIGLLFALVHFSPWYFLGLALLGALMGLCFERTGSLLAPMLLHAAYNLTSLALLGYDDLDSLELPMPMLGIAAVLGAGIAYVAYGRLRPTRPFEDGELSDGTGADPGPD